MSKLCLICSFPVIALFLWIVSDKIGWLSVGFGFLVLIAWGIISAVLEDRKIKDKAENDRYDEYIANLRNKEENVTLPDVVGSFFDVVRSVVPTKDNPIKADITYTTPKGEDFKINVEIKDKSRK